MHCGKFMNPHINLSFLQFINTNIKQADVNFGSKMTHHPQNLQHVN
uniref:Uncharacterized protein n=1 Tax=Anguilla anguilla TaxID=7936 RepID=A0A0E9Y0B4_ANGAN